jgi:murein DD-endopeptidase MepM/ murein hydrolase activator NlpD
MKEKTKVECRRGAMAALSLIAPMLLASCADLNSGPYADEQGRAPANWPQPTYFTVVVHPGDTVSAIATRYEVASAVVARMNDLDPRSDIHAGQVLRVPARSRETAEAVSREAADVKSRNYAPAPKPIDVARYDAPPEARVRVRELPAPQTKPQASPRTFDEPRIADKDADSFRPDLSSAQFVWPVHGRVISAFGRDGNGEKNDGINIAAELGAPIHASAAGTVTYSGNELKGYGNLILIRHDDGYVTAYAHAQSISVGRGDHVDKGQVIGYAGATGDVDSPQLHFEIRKGAQPVNPKLLLAAR